MPLRLDSSGKCLLAVTDHVPCLNEVEKGSLLLAGCVRPLQTVQQCMLLWAANLNTHLGKQQVSFAVLLAY